MKQFFFIVLVCLGSQLSFSQSTAFIAAQAAANNFRTAQGFSYIPSRNIYTDKDHVIHIFIFEDGNLLLGGYPTTATERDKFQVHLFVTTGNNDKYLLEYAGTFAPTLNIQNENPLKAAAPAITPVQVDFAILGPFTNTLQVTLKRQKDGNFNTISSTTISIAKTIHVSIGAGLLYTNLKNPKNIKTHVLQNGDTTLIADDINGRGMLTLFATFYPGGRPNLLIPSHKFRDHFGVLVGTAINAGASSFQDLFLGGQYDFSAGGSIVAGAHYGRRLKIVDVSYRNFIFGESKFTGSLEEKEYMKWDLGFFVGIQVDNRIFAQLFK